MNTTIVHRMIRTFTGYGSPALGKDDIGPNKADWSFFSGVAHQDDMADHQLLEAAERFHKYRNTQLPSILTDAGLIEQKGQVSSFLLGMKKQGERAKREYEQMSQQRAEKHRLCTAVKNSIEKRLLSRQWDKTTDFNNHEDQEIDGWVGKVAETHECNWDEAVSIIEQQVAEWQPPSSVRVSVQQVDDVWRNKWGKEIKSSRIALSYTYNPAFNAALKGGLKSSSMGALSCGPSWMMKWYSTKQ